MISPTRTLLQEVVHVDLGYGIHSIQGWVQARGVEVRYGGARTMMLTLATSTVAASATAAAAGAAAVAAGHRLRTVQGHGSAVVAGHAEVIVLKVGVVAVVVVAFGPVRGSARRIVDQRHGRMIVVHYRRVRVHVAVSRWGHRDEHFFCFGVLFGAW